MKNISLPPGFRDLLFDQAKRVRMAEHRLADVFESGGYNEIAPSTIEYFDLYGRGKQLVSRDVYRFLDKDDNLLALRADFTPAIARIVSSRLGTIAPPIKVWYGGSVFRKVDPQRGPYREVRQVGAELIGEGSAESDAGIINTAVACLQALQLNDIVIHINHAGIFRGVIDSLQLERPELLQEEIDRKDMRALEAKLSALGLDSAVQAQLHGLSRFVGGPAVLEEAARFVSNANAVWAIGHLQTVAGLLSDTKIVVDLAESDNMEYYTGIMFRIFSPTLKRELGGGGRYDSLFGEFGPATPAVGFSLSMDSILGEK